MVDLHFGAGGAAAHEVDGLPGIRVIQCAGHHHTGTSVFVFDVGQVAGKYIIAGVATVTVGIDGTECKGIAVVAVCALVVIHGKLVQRVSGGTGGGVSAGELGCIRIDSRQQQADRNANDRRNDNENKHTLQWPGGVEAAAEVSAGTVRTTARRHQA